MSEESKEVVIPLILIGAGVAVYVIAGTMIGGAAGGAVTLAALGVGTAIQIVLGIIALYVTAAIMGLDFGPLLTACLKLAAVFVFPDAVGALIPIAFLDWAVALGLYFWLLAYFFELEPLEVVACAVVIVLVRIAAGMLLVVLALTS